MKSGSQIPLGFEHRPAMRAEDFLVAPCNEEAVSWLDAWPDWPAPALSVHGPSGCGKTHIAEVWRARSDAAVATPETIGRLEPTELLAGHIACVVDDADSNLDEMALLHLYNVVAERRGHLLLTAKQAPARWGIELDDLRSRLAAAPAVGIHAPDEGLIGAVLIKLFQDRQLQVSQDVITYLVMRMERSFDTARRMAELLDQTALAAHRKVTIPLAREVLHRHRLG